MFITNVTPDLCERLIGKISGSGHGHQVLQISWIRSDGSRSVRSYWIRVSLISFLEASSTYFWY
jgi:hypothetical protein